MSFTVILSSLIIDVGFLSETILPSVILIFEYAVFEIYSSILFSMDRPESVNDSSSCRKMREQLSG